MEDVKKNCYDSAQELLDKLKKNEEAVDKDELNTRYKKRYEALKQDICNALTEVMRSFIFGGLYVTHGDKTSADEIFKRADAIFAEEKEKGTITRAKEIAMTTYKIEEFINAICMLNCRIRYEAYAPYWLSQCRYHEGNEEYQWYNTLVNMWYSNTAKTWVRQNGEIWDFGIYYPPNEEELKKTYEDEKTYIIEWEKKHWAEINLPQFVVS